MSSANSTSNSCPSPGHCLGDGCNIDSDCFSNWICEASLCVLPPKSLALSRTAITAISFGVPFLVVLVVGLIVLRFWSRRRRARRRSHLSTNRSSPHPTHYRLSMQSVHARDGRHSLSLPSRPSQDRVHGDVGLHPVISPETHHRSPPIPAQAYINQNHHQYAGVWRETRQDGSEIGSPTTISRPVSMASRGKSSPVRSTSREERQHPEDSGRLTNAG